MFRESECKNHYLNCTHSRISKTLVIRLISEKIGIANYRLAYTYGVLIFENLSTKNMLQNHRLAKSISDAAWNQLILNCTYKAEWAGRAVVLVDPRGTSQRCSGCGSVVRKDLSVRVHDCPLCGLVLDRDLNASLNIEALGLESLGYALEAPAFRRGE